MLTIESSILNSTGLIVRAAVASGDISILPGSADGRGYLGTQPLVSRLCRLVRNCLDDTQSEETLQALDQQESTRGSKRAGAYYGRRRMVSSPQREIPFVRPLLRLTSWQGFNAEVVLSSVNASTNACVLYRACGIMMDRCSELQARLATAFPEVRGSYVEQHQS